ncbi:MAG: hypothetical protein R3B09_16820 [Nannocystaceae bacterium]
MNATHRRTRLRALLGLPSAALLGLWTACGPTPSGGGTMTPGSTNVTSFHLSVLNACADDVVLHVGTSLQSGRKVLLFKKARDTVSGTNETIWLVDGKGEPLAMYQPIQGDQRLTVTSDCTDLRKDL